MNRWDPAESVDWQSCLPGRNAQRRNWEYPLSSNLETDAARNNDLQLWTGDEQIHNRGRGRNNLLEVVEDKRRLLALKKRSESLDERSFSCLPHPELLGNCRNNRVCVSNRRERDELDPASESVDHFLGNPKREACLTDAIWTRQR